MLTHYSTQTLTTLEISTNFIGDQGIQHLANALKQNNVTLSLIFSLYCSLPSFIQTLTIFSLNYNKISDQGAQYLADALQQNKATFSSSHPITHPLFHTDIYHPEPQWQ